MSGSEWLDACQSPAGLKAKIKIKNSYSRPWAWVYKGTPVTSGPSYAGVHEDPGPGLGFMDVTKPCEFIGLGAMGATKPYEFIGLGASPGAQDPKHSRDPGIAGTGA